MEKQELRKVLSYSQNKLMLAGYDLADLANMYHLSVHDFFYLFQMHLRANSDSLKGECTIIDSVHEVISPNTNAYFWNTSEILVPEDCYEDMVKRIFDFAYINCSNVGDTSFHHFGLDNGDKYALNKVIKNLEKKYSCIYQLRNYGWKQKISDVVIDEQDREERFALIRTK